MDPYRTSIEGQRARAEQAKRDALGEHARLTRFLLRHLDPALTARMDELRQSLEAETPSGDDATLEFWIELEGRARALLEAVAQAIDAADELRADLAEPGPPPVLPSINVGELAGPTEESSFARALPRDVTALAFTEFGSRTRATFTWNGHPFAVDAYGGNAFVVGTGVARGGPELEVAPAGIFHSLATGDEDFDATYAVRGTDEAIATWLVPPVRKALLVIARVDPVRMRIERGAVRLQYVFGIEDSRPLREAIKVLALLRQTEIRVPGLVRKR